MWTHTQIDGIVDALWYLPDDKLLEALSLKESFGLSIGSKRKRCWSDEDMRAATNAALRRVNQEDPDERIPRR